MAPKTGMLIGIGASAGLVILIVIVVLVARSGRDSVGSPTEATQAAGVLKKMELNLDLGRLVRPPPATGSGAEAAYLEAVKEAAAMGDGFIAAVKEAEDPGKNAGLQKILEKLEEGADQGLGTADLNFDAALPLVPGGEWKLRDTLVAIGTVAAKEGMSMRSDKNREGSEKALRAALIWGQRLFKNGVYVAYKSAGLGCVSEALAQFGRQYSKDFYEDAGKVGAVKEMQEQLEQTTGPWNSKEKLVRRLNPLSAPGDLWNLAENDEDRAWKLDGLMWLGPAKWTEAPAGPQRAAIQKYLEEKAASPDVLIAERKAAAEFSKADIRMFQVE